jgi:hypothetical protein
LQFSVSGCKAPTSLQVWLDNKQLKWQTNNLLDRTFYTYVVDSGFTAGTHNLTFVQVCNPNQSINQNQREPSYFFASALSLSLSIVVVVVDRASYFLCKGFEPSKGWPNRQLCSVTCHEYKNPPQFQWNNTFVSAYPTYDANNRQVGMSYRCW